MPSLINSIAISIFVDVLAELTAFVDVLLELTVFVNSTTISKNIETALLSNIDEAALIMALPFISNFKHSTYHHVPLAVFA